MSYFNRPPVKDSYLLFVDTETSGLDPEENEILELACIKTTPDGKTILQKYHTKIKPTKPVDPRAAAVNGYTEEGWQDAISLSLALKYLLDISRNSMLICHNTPFDWSFIEAALKANNMRWSSYYNRGDSMGLAWPLLRAGVVPNLKLGTLTEYFGIEHANAHTALADVEACRELYLKLMDMFRMETTQTSETPL